MRLQHHVAQLQEDCNIYVHPLTSSNSMEVYCTTNVTPFGLVIVQHRPVPIPPIDPKALRSNPTAITYFKAFRSRLLNHMGKGRQNAENWMRRCNSVRRTTVTGAIALLHKHYTMESIRTSINHP